MEQSNFEISSDIQLLKKLNEQYKSIADAIEDMVIVYDASDYMIKFATKSVSRYLGYSENELLNKKITDIVSESENAVKYFTERIIKKNTKISNRKIFIAEDSSHIPVHVVSSRIKYDSKDHILVVARDITKELAIEEKFRNTYKELNTLYSFITDLSRVHKESEAYDIFIRYLKNLGVDYVHMYRLDPSSNMIVSSCLHSNHNADIRIWKQDCLEDNPSVCKALKSGIPFAVNSTGSHYGCPFAKLHENVKSYMCFPVSTGGVYVTDATAIFTLMSFKENFFDEIIRRKINKFVELLTPVVSNLRLMEINKELSIRDALTGAYNRRFLDEVLAKEFQKAVRKQFKLSIIMLDVDNFKKFNDTHSHKAGDAVLIHLSKVVQKNIRASDIFARYGGEEFTVILPDTPKDSAVEIAERLRKTLLNEPFCYNSEHHTVTASFGVATFDDDTDDLEKLIVIADDRLYEAKKTGKNKVVA